MREEKTRHVPYKHRALGMEVEEKKIKAGETTEERKHRREPITKIKHQSIGRRD
jgi:hypothetical protein